MVVFSIEPSIRVKQQKTWHDHNLAENDKNLSCSSAAYVSDGSHLADRCSSFDLRSGPPLNLCVRVVQLRKKNFFFYISSFYCENNRVLRGLKTFVFASSKAWNYEIAGCTQRIFVDSSCNRWASLVGQDSIKWWVRQSVNLMFRLSITLFGGL